MIKLKHSNKILAQQAVKAIIDNGVTQVVISPGSRNAPLIIECNAYAEIEKFSIVDERAAGFFALGLALSSKKAVALICTSGSALLNYYPAIVEAYYSNIPLIVLSADRPIELIDIGDGQTIRQHEVFHNHIGVSISLDEKNTDSNCTKLQDALSVLQSKQLPIHINVPFTEPIYDTTESVSVKHDFRIETTSEQSLLDETPIDDTKMEVLANVWQNSHSIMVIIGVKAPDELLQKQLEHLTKFPSFIVMSESTSNTYHPEFINHIDRLIFPWNETKFKTYKPDLLITLGGHIVSKKIKQLLRAQPPKHHWHVDRYQKLDTYHVLNEYLDVSPQLFFSQLFFKVTPKESHYKTLFLKQDKERSQRHQKYLKKSPFSDLKVYQFIQKHLPKQYNIHFANSAAIRYAQFFDWSKSPYVSCNRGVSGIDGSTSTAIGFAVNTTNPTLLITGDLSFFYDSNALWNNYIPKDFRIILVNNSGGGIFRFIPGPTNSDTLDFFETSHHMDASHLCKMYNIDYYQTSDEVTLNKILEQFYGQSNQPKLLEIFTPQTLNAEVLKGYFKAMNDD